MSEVSYPSIAASALNRELIGKPFRSPYNFITGNEFVKPELENKELYHLKKTVNCLEQNLNFMQHDHCQMLEGLQKQIEKLREENQDLQFQLIMRSDRSKECDHSNINTVPDKDLSKAKMFSDQILFLKRALDEEKRKNKSLLSQLEQLKIQDNSINKEAEMKPDTPVLSDEMVFVSTDIRISLNPLVVATLQQDSGLYLTKSPLTIQDCEMVIQTLLKKMDTNSDSTEHSLLSRGLNDVSSLKIAPGIKKPLQPIRPNSRSSSVVKFNPINTTPNSNHIRLPSSQKLIPIIPQKHDKNKPEPNSLNPSRTGRESKPSEKISSYLETKTGSSLPALPKPNDYNQAERQRRLNSLQRKRLDQFNNRS